MRPKRARDRECGPDLLVPPHVVPQLMELFAGDWRPDSAGQERIMAHLTACHFCRTAIIFLLRTALEYDRGHNLSVTPASELLARFVNLSRALEAAEARQNERMGAYAEAIMAEGYEKAARDPRFAPLAAHLKTCADCRAAVEGTLDFLRQEQAPT